MAYPKMNKTYAQTYWNLTSCADRRKNKAVKYIVIHYTGTSACAKNNCIYFSGGNRNASADFFIDKDGSIYRFNGNLATRYSWHCGDGYGKYGITNYNSIGIEVVSAGAEYTAKQKEALRKLVRALMEDFNVPASRVCRHYDASRKRCPAPYAGSTAKNNKWKTLHKYITSGDTAKKAATTTASTAKKTTATAKKTTSTAKKKTVNAIAKEVIAGKWGNGNERKKKLEAAGYDYAKVQAAVNKLL